MNFTTTHPRRAVQTAELDPVAPAELAAVEGGLAPLLVYGAYAILAGVAATAAYGVGTIARDIYKFASRGGRP